MDATGIIELSKHPRAEDSTVMPQKIPNAIEWFAQEHEKAEKQHRRQKGEISDKSENSGKFVPDNGLMPVFCQCQNSKACP